MLLLKHWQIFLLMVLPGFLALPGWVGTVLHLLATSAFFLWLTAMHTEGHRKLSAWGLRTLNEARVKRFLVILYGFILLSILISGLSSEGEQSPFARLLNGFMWLPTLLLFLFLFFAFCYVLLSTAVLLARLEYRQDAEFADYLTNTLMLLLLFGGIWIIQPKLNNIFAAPLHNGKPVHG
jgi:hypothetical protein